MTQIPLSRARARRIWCNLVQTHFIANAWLFSTTFKLCAIRYVIDKLICFIGFHLKTFDTFHLSLNQNGTTNINIECRSQSVFKICHAYAMQHPPIRLIEPANLYYIIFIENAFSSIIYDIFSTWRACVRVCVWPVTVNRSLSTIYMRADTPERVFVIRITGKCSVLRL